MIVTSLSEEELKILNDAKTANVWWFNAMLDAAKVMPQRRGKYSGEGDPYTNFLIMEKMLGKPMGEIFRFYQGIKFARLLVSTDDYSDEAGNDTVRDLANYALLELGYRLREGVPNVK